MLALHQIFPQISRRGAIVSTAEEADALFRELSGLDHERAYEITKDYGDIACPSELPPARQRECARRIRAAVNAITSEVHDRLFKNLPR